MFTPPDGHTFACVVCGHTFPTSKKVTIGVVIAHMEIEHPDEFNEFAEAHTVKVDLVPIKAT